MKMQLGKGDNHKKTVYPISNTKHHKQKKKKKKKKKKKNGTVPENLTLQLCLVRDNENQFFEVAYRVHIMHVKMPAFIVIRRLNSLYTYCINFSYETVMLIKIGITLSGILPMGG